MVRSLILYLQWLNMYILVWKKIEKNLSWICNWGTFSCLSFSMERKASNQSEQDEMITFILNDQCWQALFAHFIKGDKLFLFPNWAVCFYTYVWANNYKTGHLLGCSYKSCFFLLLLIFLEGFIISGIVRKFSQQWP